jgi:exonuclease III
LGRDIGNAKDNIGGSRDGGITKFLGGLLCFYTNADRLHNKIDELRELVKVNDFDIVCISEVNPKRNRFDVGDSEISMAGYDVFLDTRYEKTKGVAVYVKEYIKAGPCSAVNSDFCCFVACEITLALQDKLVVAVVYRSPNSGNENNSSLLNLLDELYRVSTSHIYLYFSYSIYISYTVVSSLYIL